MAGINQLGMDETTGVTNKGNFVINRFLSKKRGLQYMDLFVRPCGDIITIWADIQVHTPPKITHKMGRKNIIIIYFYLKSCGVILFFDK